MKKTKVCVIIPAYNEESIILKTLNCFLNQNISKKIFEIIIVDNNSTDNTLEIVKKFSQENPSLKIEIIKELQKGIIPARVKGMEFAIEKNKKVKYLLLASTDADTEVSENWIKIILNTYKKTKADFLVGEGFFSKEFWDSIPNLRGWFRDVKKEVKSIGEDFVFMFGGCNFVISKNLFQKINSRGFLECSSDRILSVNAKILSAKFVKMQSINYVSPRRFVFHIKDLCDKGTYGIPLTNVRGNFQAQSKIANDLAKKNKLKKEKFIRNYLKEYLFLVLLLENSLIEKNKRYFVGVQEEIGKIISKYNVQDYWNNLDLLLKRAVNLTKRFWKKVYKNIHAFESNSNQPSTY